MTRSVFSALGILVLSAVLIPMEASAQCIWCNECIGDPDKKEFTYESSEYYVAGYEGQWHCGPYDNAECSHFIPCPEEEDGNEVTPVDESELLALISSGPAAGLRAFIEAHRDRVELILERDLILVKERRSCTDEIVGIFEVRGLRSALLQ